MKVPTYKVPTYKKEVEEILQKFQEGTHVVFKDQEQAKRLILVSYLEGRADGLDRGIEVISKPIKLT